MIYLERTCSTFRCGAGVSIPGHKLSEYFTSLANAANWIPPGWASVGSMVVCGECYAKISRFIWGYATISTPPTSEPDLDLPISPPPTSEPGLSDTPTK